MENWAMLIPALTSAVGAFATSSDYSTRTDNVIKAMDLEADSYITQVNILNEQGNEIDRELGDAMSQRGLEALKAEARLRAAGAETGTSGGSTDEAIAEAWMTRTLDNTILKSRASQSKTDLLRRKIMNDISFKNRMNDLSGGIASPTSAGIGVLSGGMQGFTQGLQLSSYISKPTTSSQYSGWSDNGSTGYLTNAGGGIGLQR